MRGPLFKENYRPQFSGHETFPLRYGWLKKAFDSIKGTEAGQENKYIFAGDDAIARFGVGKNMVASMRHWALATGILSEAPRSSMIRSTEIGDLIFGSNGRDPFMEHPATLWLVHWALASNPERTTWFWAFSHFPALTFNRDHFVTGLSRLAKERGWSRVSQTTLKNDVACFIRTYAAQQSLGKSVNYDGLESPLTELGLIRATGRRDGFRFVRGPKATLGDGVFAYALLKFWYGHSKSSATLSFEAVAHEPGSPGRTFLLEENDLVDKLTRLEETTDGKVRWSESAGLKQVLRESNFDFELALAFLELDYRKAIQREAA